jgi:two-component system response regulator YesN
MVAATKPRLCFVDIRMPGVDGLEALRRCVQRNSGIFWVIVSSFAEFEYAQSAIRLGVTEYLVKPVDPEALRACLERLKVLPSSPEQDPAIAAVLDYVARNYNADVSIADLADLTGFSPNYLSALFHKKMGETFMSYLTRYRVTEARKLIVAGGISVADAAKTVGYADVRHFSRRYHELLGEYPSESRQDARQDARQEGKS